MRLCCLQEIACNTTLGDVIISANNKERFKEPTVPRSDPLLHGVFLQTKQETKKPTIFYNPLFCTLSFANQTKDRKNKDRNKNKNKDKNKDKDRNKHQHTPTHKKTTTHQVRHVCHERRLDTSHTNIHTHPRGRLSTRTHRHVGRKQHNMHGPFV